MAFMSKILTDGQIRFLLLCNRIIQWCSAVIVLGVNSSFIDSGPRGLFTTYVEIIVSPSKQKFGEFYPHPFPQAVISVAVFIPALMASFVKWTWVRASAFYIDFIFSYLCDALCRYSHSVLHADFNRWLTAFIFAALDFNDGSCRLSAPAGIACTKKFAVEAFIFLTLLVLCESDGCTKC